MVICRYFQEGRCRFGENCKFEHQRSDVQRNLFGGSSGSHTWTAPKPAPTSASQTAAQDLVLALPKEMEVWEKSKMWPFSCLAMEGETEAIPGFFDTSAEELRCEAYQALKSGNMQPYIEKLKMLSEEYQNKRKELKNMRPDVKQRLVAMLEESRKKKALSYRSSALGGSMSSNPFAAPSSQATQSGGSSNPFATSSTPGTFGQSTQATTGLFGKPASTSAFSNTGNTSNSVFGNTGSSNTSNSVFGNTGSSNTSGSVFGNTGSSNTSNSVFGNTNSAFGQSGTTSANPFAQSAGTVGGAAPQSLFGGQTSTPAASSTTFGTAAPQAGLFGKPAGNPSSGSVFGGAANPSSSSSSNVFGSSGLAQPASLFGGQQKAGLLGSGPTPFGSPQTPSLMGTAAPAFSTQTSGQPGLFSASPLASTSAPAQQTLFGKPTVSQGSQPQQSLFGKPVTGMPQTAPSSGEASHPGLYTPLSELTEAEKAEFSAQSFTLGRIPLRPPPRELCM